MWSGGVNPRLSPSKRVNPKQGLGGKPQAKGGKPQVDDSSNLPRPGQGGKPQVEARNPISTPTKKWSNSLLNLLLGLPLGLETWGGAHLGGKPRVVRGVNPRLSPAKGVNPKQGGVNPSQNFNYKKHFRKMFFIIPPTGTITSGFRVLSLINRQYCLNHLASTGSKC